MADPFVDRLIDWKAFERFVADMYDEDPSLVVEHNVTEVGKSGARRQIDVRVTHTVKAHTYVTIIECKRWKEKVGHDRIDVLAATIEDLAVAKGVLLVASHFPGEFVRGRLRLRGMLCGDHLLGVRRGWWSGLGVA